MVTVSLSLSPSASVTVTITVWRPAWNTRLGAGWAESVTPSLLKSQAKARGWLPPATLARKRTLRGSMPTVGSASISTTGWASLVTLTSTASLASSPSASVTTRTTVKVPASAYAWAASIVSAVAPSPKSQAKVKGPSPPTTAAWKSTSRGAMPTRGSAWISTVGSRSGRALTATVAVATSPSASKAVQVATKLPATA